MCFNHVVHFISDLTLFFWNVKLIFNISEIGSEMWSTYVLIQCVVLATVFIYAVSFYVICLFLFLMHVFHYISLL